LYKTRHDNEEYFCSVENALVCLIDAAKPNPQAERSAAAAIAAATMMLLATTSPGPGTKASVTKPSAAAQSDVTTKQQPHAPPSN